MYKYLFMLILSLPVMSSAGLRALTEDNTFRALVIGNEFMAELDSQSYLNDAELIAASLRENGFEVTDVYNAAPGVLEKQLRKLSNLQSSGERSVTLVYLSGMGFHANGADYFVPHVIQYQNAVDRKQVNAILCKTAMPVATLHKLLDGVSRHIVLVFDSPRQSIDCQPSAKLASVVTKSASEWLYVYASERGDDMLGLDPTLSIDNSPFAWFFAQGLRQKQGSALSIFENVANSMKAIWARQGQVRRIQIESTSSGPFYLRKDPAPAEASFGEMPSR